MAGNASDYVFNPAPIYHLHRITAHAKAERATNGLFTFQQGIYTIDNSSITMPAYVPPHLRNRSTPSTPSGPSTPATPIRSATSSNNDRSIPFTYSSGSANRTPLSNSRWSSDASGVGYGSGIGHKNGSPWESGHPEKSHFSRRSYQSSPSSSYPQPNSAYNTPINSRRDNYHQSGNNGKWTDKNDSPQPRHGRAYIQHSQAQLHVFGDSFVGPFKLMDGDSVQIKTFKGASAKASIIVTTLGCRFC